MIFIGVAGNKQFGKDTLADYLQHRILDTAHQTLERSSFAKKLKEIFCDAFNVDSDFIEKWKVLDEIPDGFGCSVRDGLKKIGNGFRDIKMDVWISHLFKTGIPQICSDLRFLNELKTSAESGGLNILIDRPDRKNNDADPSEAELKPLIEWFSNVGQEGLVHDLRQQCPLPEADWIDFFIKNDSTVQQYYDKIDHLILPNILKYLDCRKLV